ncbi:MAG: SOS response-associated peptidase [Acidobacteria bacterium]|nr:SOS response-associated peptidase [Acidobacteriota bacterium]
MCGRFSLTTDPQVLAAAFGIADLPPLEGRYNIAPSQPVLAIRRLAPAEGRTAAWLRWGLVPPGSPDAPGAAALINARSESASTKPAFRRAFRERRCAIPADSFYEWAKGRRRVPYRIARRDGRPFAFAGLWERSEAPDGEPIESCTILTAAPNEVVRPLHDRMPAILADEHLEAWLDPALDDPARLQPLLRPYPAELVEAQPIDDWINDPRHEGPRCWQPQASLFGPPGPPRPR